MSRSFEYANYPNPFNPTTVIRYTVDRHCLVTLRVYDVSGGLVATLLDKAVPAGPGEIRWDGRDDRGRRVSSGVYFYRVRMPENAISKKMVVVR